MSIVKGDFVKVGEPFSTAFPDKYPVLNIDGSTAFLGNIPDEMPNAFDVSFLEVVDGDSI